MAATNYTPIQLYYSSTASAAPTAGNLTSGELAINITDGKLYYKDNGGVVQVIATKGAGTIGGSTTQIQYNNAGALAGNAAMTFNSGTNTTTLTTLNLTNALGAIYGGTAQSTYTQGDVLYASASNTLAKLGIGTVNYILTSSGSVPQWSAPSSISVLTATNLAGGLGGSVPYQSAVDTTTFLAIGAANRVMTSTGSAPQWVTSLTSLTGVSSSSITNTSLTSGRVVYSGASGVETDSASLTFNGTTLSAGGFSTTGLSTLVQTVKIGDSNFSGTAVFAAATPAKLYIGTGTVTDATSAIGATNTTGAISSLAITPIAATNTSVTYTNASTLYIAGAPSAGTNVTITNPYSLYVAAGASYFGGAVTFAGSASLAGLTVTSLTDSGLTSGRVTYATTGGLLTDSANLAFDGTNLGLGGTTNSYGSQTTLTLSGANVSRIDFRSNSIFTGSVISYQSITEGLRLETSAGYPITFYPAGTEAMRIGVATGGVGAVGIGYTTLTSVGNNGLAVLGKVGIGTSAPTGKLNVVTDNTHNGGATFDSTGTTQIWMRDTDATANTRNWGFQISGGDFNILRANDDRSTGFVTPVSFAQAPANSLIIDVSGNVGMGTASPNRTGFTAPVLSITNGTSGIVELIGTQTADGTIGQVAFYNTSSSVRIAQILGVRSGANNSGALTFQTNNAGTLGEAGRFDASGNLVVGATAVRGTAKLDVKGDTIALGSNTLYFGTISYSAGAGLLSIAAESGGGINFLSGATERGRFNSSGNLIIGSTNAQLDLNATTNNGNISVISSAANANLNLASKGAGSINFNATGGFYCTQIYSTAVGGTNRAVYSDNTGTIGYLSSVRASKINIENITNASWLMQLNPVKFNYRKKDEDGNYTEEFDNTIEYGLIAEEAEIIKQELCFYDEVDGTQVLRGVNYQKLVVPMLKAIQEQQALITILTARITALEGA